MNIGVCKISPIKYSFHVSHVLWETNFTYVGSANQHIIKHIYTQDLVYESSRRILITQIIYG